MIRPPPPSPLFPYTTLFRSHRDQRGAPRGGAGEALRGRAARRGACDLLPARRRREHPGRRVVMGLALGTAAVVLIVLLWELGRPHVLGAAVRLRAHWRERARTGAGVAYDPGRERRAELRAR